MTTNNIMKYIISLNLKAITPKNADFNEKYMFKRSTNDIIRSGKLTGNGCTDICTIFIKLARDKDIAVSRVLITADFTTHRPHTLVEIYDNKDDKYKVLDPKWMLNERLSLIAEKDQWFTSGLKQVKISNNKDLEAYSRPSPNGEDREWVLIDELPTLPVKNYNTLIRREKINKFFN